MSGATNNAVQSSQTTDFAGHAGYAGSIWHSPLVPVTLLATAGIIADRFLAVPLGLCLLALVVLLAAWFGGALLGAKHWPYGLLLVACAAGGAAWHHYRHDYFPDDDLGGGAPAVPHPVRVRGVIDEEPRRKVAHRATALDSMDRAESSTTVLRLTEGWQGEEWQRISGRVRLVIAGPVPPLHVGDAVEVAGRLSAVEGPANPGEFDQAGYLRDQGIRAVLVVRKTPDGVTRLERGWPTSFTGCLMAVRGWGQEQLGEALPEESRGVAMALLLGEGSPLTTDDWDKYVNAGVIHILAISGQHLVVLGMFLWWVLRFVGVRQRRGALLVAGFLLLYALLTGGHPPALRSAITVVAVGLGLVLRRHVLPANTFALAFLVVEMLNPTDIFGLGCQFSFLAVAVLYWGTRSWFRDAPDPLDRLLDETRPRWWRGLRWLGRLTYRTYAVTFFLWLVVTPLAAAHYHVVSPAGLLLGPPLLLLASVALIAGFLLLLAALVWQPLTVVFVPFVHGSLWLCDRVIDVALVCPGSYFHVGEVPQWWLLAYSGGLLLVLTQQGLRRHWRWATVAAAGWLGVGLLTVSVRLPSDEMRCTFLAVGHGGCTVIETPDGRVLLYDAGAIGGPDVTRRFVAPYLRSRGIRRIDEVFLSHADLDHFNGLPALLDRFAIGQVTMTPTFADKTTPGVAEALAVLRARGVPVRILKAGDHLTAGDVQIEALHPPAAGPEGNENARSLVLDVRHAGHRILLTGDLEGTGLARLLAMPPRATDVLMAPHHGSKVSNQTDLAEWARPRVVVSCQGPPRGVPVLDAVYRPTGAEVLGTWPDGAVTLRSHASGLVIETFATKQRIVLRTNREK